MDPFTGSLILGGISAFGSFFGSQTQKFTPFAPFVDLQASVFKGIQQGIEQGGFTFSDKVAAELKRTAAENIAQNFRGSTQRVTAATTPFGNIGAQGRGLQTLNTQQGIQISQAQNNVDIRQELQKQKSLQSLLQIGAGTQDPTLPAFGASNAFPSQTGVFGNALLQGAATGANIFQAQGLLGGGAPTPQAPGLLPVPKPIPPGGLLNNPNQGNKNFFLRF